MGGDLRWRSSLQLPAFVLLTSLRAQGKERAGSGLKHKKKVKSICFVLLFYYSGISLWKLFPSEKLIQKRDHFRQLVHPLFLLWNSVLYFWSNFEATSLPPGGTSGFAP